MYKVIGIAGQARSGKDTVAELIIGHLPEYNNVSFADPLKRMLSTGLKLHPMQLWGDRKEEVDDTYGLTAREMMQRLGTEWGRDLIHPDVWVKALHKSRTENGNDIHVVIPDVRFQNEADYCREHGVLIHVTGRYVPITNNHHRSEHPVAMIEGDLVIDNSGSLGQLAAKVSQLVTKLK